MKGHAIVHQRYRPSATAHHHYAWTHETHPELSTQTQNLMRMIRTPFSINTETIYANPKELQEAWQDLITKEKPEAKGHKMHFIVSYDAHIFSTARRET